MEKTQATMDLATLAIGVTIFAVIGIIGLYMLQTTSDSITFPAGSRMENSASSLGKAVQLFYDNSVIVILAVILAVVVGYLLMVRRR
jgi:hypothetical protein